MLKFPVAIALLLLTSCATFSTPRECEFCNQRSVARLPLVERSAERGGSAIALLLTGDWGWQPFEDALSTQLAADGVPVIALISPEYFARRRTIGETASAIEQVIRLYSSVWHRRQILLIGYSRGAGVLPFVVSRLPPDLRRRITEVTLIGLGSNIDFRVRRRLPFWTAHDELQIPVRPEVDKLRGLNVVCVQGEDEDESLCPKLPPGLAQKMVEPGGHSLDVDPRELARKIEAVSKPALVLRAN